MTNKFCYHISIYVISSICAFCLSCKKFIEVNTPSNRTTQLNIYNTNKTAIAAMTDIYANISNKNGSELDGNSRSGGGLTGISLMAGLTADELTLFDRNNPTLSAYYQNKLSSSQQVHIWNELYPIIISCNAVIEGTEFSNSLELGIKQQLLGEAKFVRAYSFYYLASLYGDVPMVTTTKYETNANIARSKTDEIYQQIIHDLIDAKTLLSPSYLRGDLKATTIDRVRPNKYAATALLARTYLTTRDWKNAEIEASEVIAAANLYQLCSLDSVFLKNSAETIWAIQPVGTAITAPSFTANTGEGKLFILPFTGPDQFFHPVYLNNRLVSTMESADLRKTKWVGLVNLGGIDYYYPYKYKVGTENSPTVEFPVMLRLAEQFLIRAEARAELGSFSEAVADLNMTRTRAGLSNLRSISKDEVLQFIAQEKRIELFSEWGHRWIDLKRTGRIDAVMNIEAPLKGSSWNNNWALFPIPLNDMLRNPLLKNEQNPGY